MVFFPTYGAGRLGHESFDEPSSECPHPLPVGLSLDPVRNHTHGARLCIPHSSTDAGAEDLQIGKNA
eukprot:7418236-Pyramimonas_sp.AAC.1